MKQIKKIKKIVYFVWQLAKEGNLCTECVN